MLTIANALILKGSNLNPSKENIVIDNGKIIEIAPEIKEGKIIDCTNCIVSPSFLNAHVHIGDSIIKDEGDGLSLDEMVKPPNGIKHKALENTSDEEIINDMEKSMWDMLHSGTSHFIDYREGGIKGVKLLKEASFNIPIKPIILGRDNSFYGEDPDLNLVKRNLRKLLKFADGVGLSGFGEISTEVAELITKKCKKLGKISSIHTAESNEAQVNSINKTGYTEIKRGIDASFDQLVHCTNARVEDISEISKSNTNIVLCPRANATLNVGIPPIDKILSQNIIPFIGSDNIMLNSPNIIRDLEFILKLSRAYYKKYFNPKVFFEMATVNPYKFKDLNSNLYGCLNKSIIKKGLDAQLMISNQLSKNPYLSIINRCDTQNILHIMNKNKHIDYINKQIYNI
ncbi:chlorohydrolase [Methanobrevibacter sp. 87.7]|uniref:amidohydrolase family protein n=1 Tax=Methanobrevibacter sp. 87.7 TaxID=387957 RepID=UPI000B502021|nr:amidohydrolase family protein [Methanobrevibacter sp. 87.7]OWT33757.1 chlorohydrolase [Methanobrevibacter sp. 87.7]